MIVQLRETLESWDKGESPFIEGSSLRDLEDELRPHINDFDYVPVLEELKTKLLKGGQTPRIEECVRIINEALGI